MGLYSEATISETLFERFVLFKAGGAGQFILAHLPGAIDAVFSGRKQPQEDHARHKGDPRPQETHTRDDVGGDAVKVRTRREPGRENGEQAGADTDEDERAKTGHLVAAIALQPDQTTRQYRQQYLKDIFRAYNRLPSRQEF